METDQNINGQKTDRQIDDQRNMQNISVCPKDKQAKKWRYSSQYNNKYTFNITRRHERNKQLYVMDVPNKNKCFV